MQKIYSPDELRAIVRECGLTQSELSSEINYSTTTLSLWLRGQYPNDASKLEAAIAHWVSASALSPRDRRKISYIQDLLDHAEDKQAIIDTILRNATTQTKGRSASTMPTLPLAQGIDRADGDAMAEHHTARPPVPKLQAGVRK